MTPSESPPPLGRNTPEGRNASSVRPANGKGRRGSLSLRLSDVRPGEGPAVLGASLNLAGIVAAHVALETARDTLFLTQLSAHSLAFVYLAMASLAALVGRFGHAIERVLGRSNALILSLMVAAMGNTLFYVADRSDALTFAFYLWVGLSGTLLLLQFWLFSAARFTPAQGRRLYGLIAAGGVLGAVLGGAMSRAVTEWMHVETLLAVAAMIHLLTALLVTTAPPATNLPDQGKAASFGESIRNMRGDPYIRRIVLVSFMSTMTLLVVDYVFKSVTASRFEGDDLGRFLATYYMGMNAAALVIQVFIAMRVLQRAGTVLTLTLLPIALVLSLGFPLVFGGVLVAALLTKGVDGALRHSLHRVSMELLFLPLSASARSSLKALVDSLVTRGTQGLTALVLLGFSAAGLDRPVFLFGLIAVGAVGWFFAALSLRRHYLNQFRASIGRGRGLPEFHLDQLTLDGVEVVIESLSSPDETEVLSAMTLFEQAGRTGLIPALLLYHPSERVVSRALELIPNRHRRDWPPLTERLVEHQSSEVRLAAVRALGRFGYLEKLRPDTFRQAPIAATAAFFRADQLSNPLTDPHILELTRTDADISAQVALVKTIAEFGSPKWGDVLLDLQNVDHPRLARRLPKAMTRVRDARFIPALISRLAIREGSEEVRVALASMGTAAFEQLKVAILDDETPHELRMRLPQAIARQQNQKAAEFLVDCLHAPLPGAVRYRTLLALGELSSRTKMRFSRSRILPLVEQNAHESLRAALLAEVIAESMQQHSPSAVASGTLLVSLLRDKHEQSLERITRLLQLLHRRENLRQVKYALLDDDPSARSAAGELLEVITLGYDESLRELLRSLSEPTSPLIRYEHLVELLGLKVDDLADALRNLLFDPDPAVSALAADYAERAEVLEVAVEVQEVLEQNPWLNAQASSIAEQAGSTTESVAP